MNPLSLLDAHPVDSAGNLRIYFNVLPPLNGGGIRFFDSYGIGRNRHDRVRLLSALLYITAGYEPCNGE